MIDKSVKVSIIVPVYNMEGTLARCLDSIVKQDFKDFEVILINDGSVDKSSEICGYYTEKYDFFRYRSRENLGLPYTLKEGIELSLGEFLVFIDSDDYVEHNLISALLSAQKDNNADIVQSGISYIKVNGETKSQLKMKNRVITDKSSLYRAYFVERTMNRTMASALFRKSLFNDISFTKEVLSIDICLMPFLLEKCVVFQQIENVCYNAVQYPDSVSRGKFSDKMYNDKIHCNLVLESFFEKYAPQLKEYMYYRRSSISVFLYTELMSTKDGMISDRDNKLYACKKMFSDNYPLLQKSSLYNDFNKKERIKLKLFSITPMLYMVIMRLYEMWMNCSIKK